MMIVAHILSHILHDQTVAAVYLHANMHAYTCTQTHTHTRGENREQRVGRQLASSPGLFITLNITKEMKEMNGRTDKCARKIGLVSIAGVVVCMR